MIFLKRFLALFGFVAAIALGGCASVQRWQESLQGESAEKRQFVTRKAWIRQTTAVQNEKFRKINRMKPLLYKNWVIQGNAIDGVVSYDQDSGKEKWRAKIENGVEASGALIKDRLFVGGNDGFFYSLNADNGQTIWSFPTRIENLSEPLLVDGTLYFLNGANTLYALDAATGKQLWLYTRQDPNSLSIRGGSRPALRNGTLYVGFSDGAIVALDSKSGTVKWEKIISQNKRFKDLDSDPLVDGDFLYLLGYDDQAYCLRAATGEVVWKSEKGGFGSILSAGDYLYFASTNSEFVAVAKDTGKRIWAHGLRDGIPTAASFYKGLIVIGESQGQLRFLDARSGKLISSFDPGRGVLAQPAVDEKTNSIFFISGEANLYKLEAGWRYPGQISYLR